MKNLYELMTHHKSIRKYKSDPIPDSDLEKILTAAIHGPSSVNGQQWSVIVVKNPDTRKLLAEYTGNQPWVEQAPVFLLFVGDYHRIAHTLHRQKVPFANMDSIEATMVASVDAGIALSNAMNLAESMGYGIVPIGAVRREPDKLIELFRLPPYVYPIVGLCVGIPDEQPMLRPRFPLSVMIHQEVYDPQQTETQIADYDKVTEEYMRQRSDGQDIRSWSQNMAEIYGQVYFPKVNSTLKLQGYTNQK